MYLNYNSSKICIHFVFWALADPECTKMTARLAVSFGALWTCVKAAHKTLVKLTPGGT